LPNVARWSRLARKGAARWVGARPYLRPASGCIADLSSCTRCIVFCTKSLMVRFVQSLQRESATASSSSSVDFQKKELGNGRLQNPGRRLAVRARGQGDQAQRGGQWAPRAHSSEFQKRARGAASGGRSEQWDVLPAVAWRASRLCRLAGIPANGEGESPRAVRRRCASTAGTLQVQLAFDFEQLAAHADANANASST
jgi:hypothetical protein